MKSTRMLVILVVLTLLASGCQALPGANSGDILIGNVQDITGLTAAWGEGQPAPNNGRADDEGRCCASFGTQRPVQAVSI